MVGGERATEAEQDLKQQSDMRWLWKLYLNEKEDPSSGITDVSKNPQGKQESADKILTAWFRVIANEASELHISRTTTRPIWSL